MVHVSCIIEGDDIKCEETNIPFKFPYKMFVKFGFHTWSIQIAMSDLFKCVRGYDLVLLSNKISLERGFRYGSWREGEL